MNCLKYITFSIALSSIGSLVGCAYDHEHPTRAKDLVPLIPVEANESLQPEHGLRFDFELTNRLLDNLVNKGAELCFPASVVQAKLRKDRIAHELEGGLMHDAANDIIIQRRLLSRLERQLDYVKQYEICEVPATTIETSSSKGATENIWEKLDKLLNSDNQFAFNSSELNPKYIVRLAEAVSLLRELPEHHLEITGHADSYGREEYNRALSMARAKQVGRYLQIMGIKPERISVSAVGSESPLLPGGQAEKRLVNRRVSINLIEVSGDKEVNSYKKTSSDKKENSDENY